MSGASDIRVESNLCSKCCVIRFDDGALGGHVSVDEDGLHRLDFDASKLDFGDRPNRLTGYIELDFRHEDLLPDLPDLDASFKAGCDFCGALRRAALALDMGREWSDTVSFELRYVLSSYPGDRFRGICALEARVGSFKSWDTATTESIFFYMDCANEKCADWLGSILAPEQTTLCKDNIDWLHEELENCSRTCCPTVLTGFLPTRLLELGLGSSTDDCKLVETADVEYPQHLRYAALSYCWGGKEEALCQLKTHAGNVKSHLERVTFASLTQVLKDAVTTARALSLRYLWVDALCIIQGDLQDWTRESERMGSVYANAFVTFCTLASPSCLHGYLERPRPINFAFQSTICSEVQGTCFLRHQPVFKYTATDRHEGGVRDPRWLDLSASPWATRAWTYQEMHLAKRKIYFGVSRMYFSCETFEVREPPRFERTRMEGVQYLGSRSDTMNTSDNVNEYELWRSIAEDFSRCKITNPTDKLPAISGLAKLTAGRVKDEYHAGCWSGDILLELLWTNTGSFDVQPPTDAYCVPTWSWMNYDIEFLANHGGDINWKSECESVSAASVAEDPLLNPWGRIVSASVEVQGVLLKAGPIWTPMLNAYKKAPLAPAGLMSFLDSELAICVLDEKADDQDWLWEPRRLDEAYLLLLASATQQDDENSSQSKEDLPPYEDWAERNAWGLVLQRISDKSEFRRIGIFEVPAKRGGTQPFSSVSTTFVEIL